MESSGEPRFQEGQHKAPSSASTSLARQTRLARGRFTTSVQPLTGVAAVALVSDKFAIAGRKAATTHANAITAAAGHVRRVPGVASRIARSLCSRSLAALIAVACGTACRGSGSAKSITSKQQPRVIAPRLRQVGHHRRVAARFLAGPQLPADRTDDRQPPKHHANRKLQQSHQVVAALDMNQLVQQQGLALRMR